MIVTAVVAGLSGPLHAGSPAPSFEDAASHLTTDLVGWVGPAAKPEGRPIIAVLAFTRLEGGIATDGKSFAEELTTQLFLTKRFRVVERTLLDRVLSDNRLARDGILAPSSVSELGRLTNATAIVTGTIADLGTHQRINARVISTVDGHVLAAATVSVMAAGTGRVADHALVAPPTPPAQEPEEGCAVILKEAYGLIDSWKPNWGWKVELGVGGVSLLGKRQLEVMKHYDVDVMCSLERPGPGHTCGCSTVLFLVKGVPPSGSMPGETCRAFDPASLAISQANSNWRIEADKRMVAEFGTNEAAARRGLAIVQRYGPSFLCTTSDPLDRFKYFRN